MMATSCRCGDLNRLPIFRILPGLFYGYEWDLFFENFSVRGEGTREKFTCQLRAQVLRVAASRVGPLALRLRERVQLFSGPGPLIIVGDWVSDTTPVMPVMNV